MNKSLTNLLRSAFAVACIALGASASYAQVQVIAAGGTTDDQYSCTIGETIVSAEAGLWTGAVDITTGINGIYSDGQVIVGNNAADGSLNIQLTEEMIAQGAHYNIYNIKGMLLESNRIGSTDFVLKYGKHLRNTAIIVTINTPKGVVKTYKLSK